MPSSRRYVYLFIPSSSALLACRVRYSCIIDYHIASNCRRYISPYVRSSTRFSVDQVLIRRCWSQRNHVSRRHTLPLIARPPPHPLLCIFRISCLCCVFLPSYFLPLLHVIASGYINWAILLTLVPRTCTECPLFGHSSLLGERASESLH